LWVKWFSDCYVEDDFEGEADTRALAKELLYAPAMAIEDKSSDPCRESSDPR
jgi:hypothetical protein